MRSAVTNENVIFSYIFSADLENTSHLSCIKILIRLARTSSEIAERIVSHTSLMGCLVRQFERMGSPGDRKTKHLYYFILFLIIIYSIF